MFQEKAYFWGRGRRRQRPGDVSCSRQGCKVSWLNEHFCSYFSLYVIILILTFDKNEGSFKPAYYCTNASNLNSLSAQIADTEATGDSVLAWDHSKQRHQRPQSQIHRFCSRKGEPHENHSNTFHNAHLHINVCQCR